MSTVQTTPITIKLIVCLHQVNNLNGFCNKHTGKYKQFIHKGYNEKLHLTYSFIYACSFRVIVWQICYIHIIKYSVQLNTDNN